MIPTCPVEISGLGVIALWGPPDASRNRQIHLHSFGLQLFMLSHANRIKKPLTEEATTKDLPQPGSLKQPIAVFATSRSLEENHKHLEENPKNHQKSRRKSQKSFLRKVCSSQKNEANILNSRPERKGYDLAKDFRGARLAAFRAALCQSRPKRGEGQLILKTQKNSFWLENKSEVSFSFVFLCFYDVFFFFQNDGCSWHSMHKLSQGISQKGAPAIWVHHCSPKCLHLEPPPNATLKMPLANRTQLLGHFFGVFMYRKTSV